MYANLYETLTPAPMKSAGLKLDARGDVAWNEIWDSFCDLALAGGPPHKGALLGPASAAEVDAHPEQYDRVVREVCRGVEMVTSMPCEPAETPGWVRVECYSPTMAAWLLRAIVTENVAARAAGGMLDLPVAPVLSSREGNQKHRHGQRQDQPLLARAHAARAAARYRGAARVSRPRRLHS